MTQSNWFDWPSQMPSQIPRAPSLRHTILSLGGVYFGRINLRQHLLDDTVIGRIYMYTVRCIKKVDGEGYQSLLAPVI